eukprot:9640522-Heterocapsa_arctica.AAC.1
MRPRRPRALLVHRTSLGRLAPEAAVRRAVRRDLLRRGLRPAGRQDLRPDSPSRRWSGCRMRS